MGSEKELKTADRKVLKSCAIDVSTLQRLEEIAGERAREAGRPYTTSRLIREALAEFVRED